MSMLHTSEELSEPDPARGLLDGQLTFGLGSSTRLSRIAVISSGSERAGGRNAIVPTPTSSYSVKGNLNGGLRCSKELSHLRSPLS
jgi:hypothetical protein